ncbi:MAG: AmmeMemoRadiSam system protein B [Candidatus Nanoarchaeia archaeon]
MGVRSSVVAGQFYESSPDRLRKQINSCFLSKFGPGSLPYAKKSKKIFGCIVPHAGYQFSGPAAAFAYKAIAESRKPKNFIILGPNHSGMGAEVSTSLLDWETPLGVVKVDADFVSKLVKKCDFIEVDDSAHLYEHSIEVQLPFLQFVLKDKFKFVPICLASHDFKILKRLGECIALIGRDSCVVASSDMTHYGYGYGYLPFSQNKKENMYKLDKRAIDAITSLDVSAFVSHIERSHATICGYAPIITAVFAVKKLGCKKARLLKYYTSGDVLNDYSSSVGYASIVFE